MGWIDYPFSTINGVIVELWEWMSNIIPPVIMDVITYPRQDWSLSMLVKVATASILKHSQGRFIFGTDTWTLHNNWLDIDWLRNYWYMHIAFIIIIPVITSLAGHIWVSLIFFYSLFNTEEFLSFSCLAERNSVIYPYILIHLVLVDVLSD